MQWYNNNTTAKEGSNLFSDPIWSLTAVFKRLKSDVSAQRFISLNENVNYSFTVCLKPDWLKKKKKQAQIGFLVKYYPIKTWWLFRLSCSFDTWQKLDHRSGFLINNTWQLVLSRKDLILLAVSLFKEMKEKRETPARSNSWHLWHFIQRKGARVVKVSQQQTSVRATSAGLQLIDILTSYISWHLPVMDDTPLHRAIPASFLCGRCLCVVYSENTATPSRACSENLAHGTLNQQTH